MASQKGDKSLIADFFGQCKPFSFKRGEIVLRPYYLNPGVNFIEKGHVKVYSITEEGEEKIHLIFKTGEMFPLLWVFRGVKREVYYEALDDVLIRRATKEAFFDFFRKQPDALMGLVDEILTIVNVYVSRIDTLEYTKSYPRLISRIIDLAGRFGRRQGRTIVIELPLVHSDIAASANMTRETASREIEALIKKKLIIYRRKMITVVNMPRLKRELSLHAVRESL